ncbi:MAG: hypothetical protein HY980_00020 [Candidatus Magasanikbacteria bacterium]|nr:hypothetical protein [Candidatus Magasanikbacteria bacterium]
MPEKTGDSILSREIREQEETIELVGPMNAVNRAGYELEHGGRVLSDWDTDKSMRGEIRRRIQNKVNAEAELIGILPTAWKEFTVDQILNGEARYVGYLNLLSSCDIGNLKFIYGPRKIPNRIDETEVKKGVKHFEELGKAARQCREERGSAYLSILCGHGEGETIAESYKKFYELQAEVLKMAEQAAPYWWVLIIKQKENY